jgi:hypothetical protein
VGVRPALRYTSSGTGVDIVVVVVEEGDRRQLYMMHLCGSDCRIKGPPSLDKESQNGQRDRLELCDRVIGTVATTLGRVQ